MSYLFNPSRRTLLGDFSLLVLLLLPLCLGACSGNLFPIGRVPLPQSMKILTNQIDPCSLVTQEQIKQVVKTPLTLDQRPEKVLGAYQSGDVCSYTGPDSANPDVAVDISLFIHKNSEDALADLQNIRAVSEPKVTVLTDLGVPAVLDTGTFVLFAQKDNGMVTVSVVSNEPEKDRIEQAKQIVLLMLRNM